MVRIIAVVLALLFANMAAAAELSVVFVPNKGAELAPVELVYPDAEKSSVMARASMWRLEKELETELHPMERGYNRTHEEKCTVDVRDQKDSVLYFRAQCWAVPLQKGSTGYEKLGGFESPEQVAAFIREFSQERLAEKHLLCLRYLHNQASRRMPLI